jgi:hypothetical protein
MLRNKIGDDAFFKACRNYLGGSNLYGFGYTSELQKEMELASGQNLSVFFQQWFFGEGFPYLKINWKQLGSKVKLSIEQTPSNSEVPFWHINVPIEFRNKTRKLLLNFEPQQLVANYEFDLDFSADTAIFDPNVTVLSKASLGGVNLDKIQQDEIVILPNPGSQVFQVVSRNPSLKMIEIFNVLGEKMGTIDLGISASKSLYVDASKWSAGTYFIRINTENFVYSKKWLKQ